MQGVSATVSKSLRGSLQTVSSLLGFWSQVIQPMPHGSLNKTALYRAFSSRGLTTESDALVIAATLDQLGKNLSQDICWDITRIKSLHSFTATHPSIPWYKGKDARPLLLAVHNIFKTSSEQKLIRKHNCKSHHCINPSHYFYGDHLELTLEKWKRSGLNINKDIYYKIIELRKESPKTYTYGKLSEMFEISSRTIRTICSNSNV